MAQNAQTARGMRDVVPPEAELRRQVANRVLDVYASYGYEVIETPALEDLGALVGSEGGENEKLIFKVLKRGAKLEEALALARAGESEELADLGMRFDLTVPLARFVANHLNELPVPFKVAHLGPVWRAERPARGRYREFTQCDIDIIGEPGVAAEVELCSATLEALERVGIHGCTVRLNDRRLLRSTVEHYLGHLDEPGPVYIALDHLDRADPDAIVAELVRAGHDVDQLRQLLGAIGTSEVVGPDAVKAELQQTLHNLRELGASARFDPALVRGMGYYTGPDLRGVPPRSALLPRRRGPLRRHDCALRRPSPPYVRFLDRFRARPRPRRPRHAGPRPPQRVRDLRKRRGAAELSACRTFQAGAGPGAGPQRGTSGTQRAEATRGLPTIGL